MASSTIRRRVWTTLTASALAAPGAYAATVKPETPMAPAAEAAPAALPGGEGGEGGEGGIDPADATTDPVAFLTALEVIAAHYIAGRDAYHAGDHEAAASMFAHPMAEVYADMAPVFAELGVAPFDTAIEATVDAALGESTVGEVDARAEAVLAALRRAARQAPQDSRSAVAVQAEVLADLVDRAALLYQRVAADAGGDAYIDGYGFSRAAEALAAREAPAITAAAPVVGRRLDEALAMLREVYPSAREPDDHRIDPGAVLAASSRLSLSLGRLAGR
jgi:hypothetical protein